MSAPPTPETSEPASASIAAPPGGPAATAPACARRRFSFHALMVVIHRYVGLGIATFVFVAALTGSVLAFFHELDGLVNPYHRVTPATPETPFLDPFVLRERVAALLPDSEVEVQLAPEREEALSYWQQITPATWREHLVDPYTGAVLGARTWGDLSEGSINFFTFLYRLHYELALGTVGMWLLGIAALLWTLDCFVGMYLTFPPRRSSTSAKDDRSWLARWKPSWLVKGGSLFGTIFTIHRAGGLWAWPLLFVFAWSGVGFNVGPVFKPVMALFGTNGDPHVDVPVLATPREKPALDWQNAHATAKAVMQSQASARGFAIHAEDHLGYDAKTGTYHYAVHSSLDLVTRWAGTSVTIDGDSGTLVRFDAPTGLATGDTLTTWLFALHMGAIGGLAYRIVVCVAGLLIAGLCVTGVWIWWRKRALRRTASAE